MIISYGEEEKKYFKKTFKLKEILNYKIKNFSKNIFRRFSWKFLKMRL